MIETAMSYYQKNNNLDIENIFEMLCSLIREKNPDKEKKGGWPMSNTLYY